MKRNIFLLGSVLCCAGMSMPAFTSAQPQTESKQYLQRLPTCNWVDDSHFLLYKTMSRNEIPVLINAKTGEGTPFVQPAKVTPAKPAVEISRNGESIIAGVDGNETKISDIQNATFSPDSLQIAFTRSNDLYVLDVRTRQEWRVTSDGSSSVYNGWSSWVYNEEILGRAMKYRAFWWSPDSRSLAFMHFDDTKVPVYTLFSDTGSHGKYVNIHYPQPGDPNPEVKIGVANLKDKKIVWAGYDAHHDQYFGTPVWRPDSKALWIQWMDRRQDSLMIEEMDLQNGDHRNVYTETQKTWVALDEENRITFVPSRNMFLLKSDKSGWMHLYAFTMDGKLIGQVTKGEWGVQEINYIDEKKGWIYFTSAKENSTRTDLYKIKLDGTGMQRLSFGDFTHRFKLSPSASYFITTYSNYHTPGKVALLDNNGKLIRELADEKGKDYATFEEPSYSMLRVKTVDGFELPVRISWPTHLDSTKKYPAMVQIYGGPNSMMVRDGYVAGFVSANEANDMIRIQIDHRGSGHFGKKGQDYMYGNLGKWEIEDYSTVVRWLEQKYPFIDTARIGITGFSYGGYVTCLALTKGADVFKYGIAGGSVTDWMLYDTHYTERYMGLPANNPQGYKAASVMTYVNNYRGVLRLEQGTMDDNVHLQNTLQLVSALEDAEKHFELMLYPGASHGWYFLRGKANHGRAEATRFINTYLIKK